MRAAKAAPGPRTSPSAKGRVSAATVSPVVSSRPTQARGTVAGVDRLVGMVQAVGHQLSTGGRPRGQNVFRTGLSKVGLPGSPVVMQTADPTIASLLKGLGYATGHWPPGTTTTGGSSGPTPRRTATSTGFNLRTDPFGYPPRQAAPSFSIDQALATLSAGITSG